mgnify:CR=1 FL=1
MAKKRMFSLQIVDTDAFLDMPSSSQLLYYHMAMRADDEGFIGNPKRIMRMTGASEDDYKVLVAKKFIIPFESGVCVIKHWLVHNTIRMDRFGGTTYLKEKAQLVLKDNKAYKLVDISPEIDGLPNGNQMVPQVKLSKVNISKDSIAETSSAPFSFKEEIQKMEDSLRRDLNVIALYFSHRKPDIKDKPQLSVAIKRHLRPAKDLAVFTDNQILKGFELASKQTPEWTLETVVKMLTK